MAGHGVDVLGSIGGGCAQLRALAEHVVRQPGDEGLVHRVALRPIG
jgi:hypothetical protein